jgi:anti-sigma B factor antagonist
VSAASELTAAVVRPSGDLTILTAAERKDELLAALAAADHDLGLEVDLTDVEDLDTAGLQLLLALRSEAAIRDVPLRLVNIGGRAEIVLRAVGLRPDLAPQDSPDATDERWDHVR